MVDNQNMQNLCTSLCHGTLICSCFQDFQTDILVEAAVNNKDTKEEGDSELACLAGKQLGSNMADDELTDVAFCISSFCFETKLLSYFLVDLVQLQVRIGVLLKCNFL